MQIFSGSRYVTALTERDEHGRFTRGNTICQQGFQAMLDRHFDGDRAAFRAWFAQLGRFAYGLNYKRKGKDFDYYEPWVKPCFRLHPGTPVVFMQQWRNCLADVNFYSEGVQP
ncbi:MAG: hypothetical protein U0350_49275 [Caldilineaceae bacterium]